MNRRQRRAQARRRAPELAKKIDALSARVEATGKPGVIYGLTGACRDCTAEGQLILLPGNKMTEKVFHDAGCPVLSGVVTWQPVVPS